MSEDLNELLQLASVEYRSKVVLGLTIVNHADIVDTYFPKYEENCIKYGITKSEFFVYTLLTGTFCSEIQSPLVLGKAPNKIITKCIELYDSLLSKIPLTQHQLIYRKEKYFTLEYFEKAREKRIPFEYKHYLTGSKDDFRGELQLVITPLNKGKTRAHDVYLIYNHGEISAAAEYQINFERNTSFLIDEIDYCKNTTYVYCHEV